MGGWRGSGVGLGMLGRGQARGGGGEMLSHGVAFFVCFNENNEEDLDGFIQMSQSFSYDYLGDEVLGIKPHLISIQLY